MKTSVKFEGTEYNVHPKIKQAVEQVFEKIEENKRLNAYVELINENLAKLAINLGYTDREEIALLAESEKLEPFEFIIKKAVERLN